jgi:hypothetical protein
LGLTGAVPRVDAEVKAGLLDLVDPAVGAGWSLRRACVLLEVNHVRVLAWRERLAAGVGLDDAAPGPTQAVHALLDRERDEIITVYDDWHEIDRSYRKLAHRGSREDRVHASESTFWRVLAVEGLVLPKPAREPAARKPWPDWVEYRPCQVWGHDFTHFTRADRVAIAVLDLVSRYWITTLVSAEESSEQGHRGVHDRVGRPRAARGGRAADDRAQQRRGPAGSCSPSRTFILRSAGAWPFPLVVRSEQSGCDSLPVDRGNGQAPHPGTCALLRTRRPTACACRIPDSECLVRRVSLRVRSRLGRRS